MTEKNKDKLVEQANEAYYEGDSPIITDEEFNLLTDSGLVRADEHTFRKKVRHTIPMGSLSKSKGLEEFEAWLRKTNAKRYLISPKVDGNSIAITYRNGRLVSAATRGDGEYGNDCTDKVKASGTVPHHLSEPLNITVRCEAVFPRSQQEHHEKNIRNIVSGLLNSKDVQPGLRDVRFLVFDYVNLDEDGILSAMDWKFHEDYIGATGFHKIDHTMVEAFVPETVCDAVEQSYLKWDNEYPYFIDGVVVEALNDDGTQIRKEGTHPVHMTAVKFQRAPVRANVGKVEWTLGMHSKLAPVLVLEAPVTIDGTSVQRVSASNYGIVCAAGLWPGAEVGVVKSGDIIPYIAEVYERSTSESIVVCPECNRQAEVDDRRIDLICPYDDCSGKGLIKLQNIFKILDIDGISDKTIENLYNDGYTDIIKLSNIYANELAQMEGWGLKSAEQFVTSLKEAKVTEAQIIACVGIRGISVKQAEKLIYAYGSISEMCSGVRKMGGLKIIEGFGDILSTLVATNIQAIANMEIDFKMAGITVVNPAENVDLVPVCVTGPHPTMSRKEFSRFLEAHGYKLVSSVTKECKTVLTADMNSSSSKMKKAKSRDDVKIVLYDVFESWLAMRGAMDNHEEGVLNER